MFIKHILFTKGQCNTVPDVLSCLEEKETTNSAHLAVTHTRI